MSRLPALSVRFVSALVAAVLVNCSLSAQAATLFTPANAVWNSAGNWSLGLPDNTQDGDIPSGKIAQANSLFTNTNINVKSGGLLRVTLGTQVLSGGAINVESGGRLEYQGNTGTLGAHNTINLQDNSTLGRDVASTSPTDTLVADDINVIGASSTVYFRGGFSGGRSMTITGALTGGSGTTLIGENNLTSFMPIYFSSSTGNSFAGKVIVRGISTTRGNFGAVGFRPLGTAAGGNVEVQAYGTLKIQSSTGVTNTGIVNVLTNGRIDYDGATNSGNTINLATGTTIGRNTITTTGMGVTTTVSDTINIASGASIRLYGAYTSSRKLILSGPITGSNVTITMSNETGTAHNEEARITSASGNALTGTMIVKGDDAANPGVLGLVGTTPIGTMSLQIQPFGNVLVSPGAANGLPSIDVQNGGHLRLRNSGGSTLANTTITGTGRVRSETTGSSPITADVAVQTLALNNVILSPGNSAGTLTLEASTVSLASNSTLQVELGTLSDLLVVNGNLNLSAGPALKLLPLAGLGTGNYVIATYTGTLTGTFGSVIDNLGGFYSFASINYGSLSNSQITLTITAIPEPSSVLLLGLGLVGLVRARRQKGVRA